eukprot:GFUD01001314.1.p1 GENE.GFUD01001314.1~~GFUD01001314.1.p1  ORF type:complete len:116 (+),score=34.06 GFUD01001314.1:93-440(+)
MGGSRSSERQDIVKMLAMLDMRHILDHILSYLDMETLNMVEMVSPLWAWVVQSSSLAYKNKVLTLLKWLVVPSPCSPMSSLVLPVKNCTRTTKYSYTGDKHCDDRWRYRSKKIKL